VLHLQTEVGRHCLHTIGSLGGFPLGAVK
jgi:hypothetical protein